MVSPIPPFQKFITRVHRRYVLIHIVENGVIGLAFGAVAGILLTTILIWRGLPTESISIAAPLLGLALGLIWGASSRPKRMDAATKADQQLELADLLGSALTVLDSTDWAETIRSQADEVSRRLSPSDVILHRLGVRVWGGAGLASALLVALALIPTAANPSLARQNNEILAESGNAELIRSASIPRAMAIQADPDSAQRSQYGDLASDGKQRDPLSPADRTDAPASAGKQAARGAGAASSDELGERRLKLNTGTKFKPDGQTTADGPGIESAGSDRAMSAGAANAANPSERALPPWKTSGWDARRSKVQSDLQSGHLPDGYRDMLSGYFDNH